MTRLRALLCVLPLLQPALAQAEGTAPQPCPTAVQLEGEAALTGAIAQVLRSHGIVTQPPAGCPQSFVRVTRGLTGLVVGIHQQLAQTERTVSDPAVAAALIESWMRNDLTDPLLAAPDLMEPPAPPLPPPPIVPPVAPPAPRAGPRFTVSLLFEGGIDKDAVTWLGGSLHGCAPVGPLCLGATVRTLADVPPTTVGGYADQRVAVDVLASVIWPVRRGRWLIAPGLGLGAGWLRYKATPLTGTNERETEGVTTMDAKTMEGSDGGIRAEARLLVLLRLRAGWQLASSLALGTAFLDGPAAQLPSGELLPVAPWAMVRGGLGLAWSAP